MATGTHELGDYIIRDDGNGDYEIEGPNGNIRFQLDDSTGNITFNDDTGTAILEWDESNTRWDFQDNTVDLDDVSGLSSNNLTNLEGDNLTVDGSGNLDASAGQTTRNENTLSDTGKAQLLDVASTTAKVTVIDETNDEISTWFLRGSNNDAQKLFDSNTAFANSEGNDTTVNVYWDSGNSRYEVNNETGGQITVAAIDVRKS